MKINPESALGAILILLITAGATFLFLNNNQIDQSSSLTLDSEQNKFRLALNLKEEDKQTFQEFVNNLVGLTYPSEDFVFTLDSTSSASLAFKTPIKADVEIEEKSIKLSGSLNSALSLLKPNFEQPKIPSASELVIVGEDLSSFFYDRLNLSENSKEQLEQLIEPEEGTYFTSFNSGKSFALFFKQDIDLENITSSDLKFESTQSASQENIKIYQAKLPSSKQDVLEVKPVLFKKESYKVIASSIETANLILESDKFIENKEEFTTSNLAIYFKPGQAFDAENFSAFITNDGLNQINFKENFEKSLENVNDFNFSLKGIHFSALINLK